MQRSTKTHIFVERSVVCANPSFLREEILRVCASFILMAADPVLEAVIGGWLLSALVKKSVHSPSFSFRPVTLIGQMHLIVLFA